MHARGWGTFCSRACSWAFVVGSTLHPPHQRSSRITSRSPASGPFGPQAIELVEKQSKSSGKGSHSLNLPPPWVTRGWYHSTQVPQERYHRGLTAGRTRPAYVATFGVVSPHHRPPRRSAFCGVYTAQASNTAIVCLLWSVLNRSSNCASGSLWIPEDPGEWLVLEYQDERGLSM